MKIYGRFISFLVVTAILLAFNLNVSAEETKSKGEKFSKYKLGDKFKEKNSNIDKLDLSKKFNGKDSLPTVVSHINDMPPVGDQGSQGSCTGWATSYYKGYQEKKDMQWGNVMFSPSFVYNQINGGTDNGSSQEDAYALLMNLGHCKLSTMPYNENNWTTQPNSTQLNEASNFKASNWSYLVSDGYNWAAKTEDLKNWLQNDCLTVSMPILDNYDFWTGFYDDDSGSVIGYHALCIMGYSDDKQAFKFINSWGKDYGYSGYGYISYDLWDKFVEDDMTASRGMIDADSDPIIQPKYKYTLKFTDARVVATGSHSAGNQWGFVVKNESKSAKVIYKRQNTSNPITTDKSIQTNYDGCYIGFHEYDSSSKNDDYFKKTYTHLDEGENIIYCTIYDKQMSGYWTKWRVKVERIINTSTATSAPTKPPINN